MLLSYLIALTLNFTPFLDSSNVESEKHYAFIKGNQDIENHTLEKDLFPSSESNDFGLGLLPLPNNEEIVLAPLPLPGDSSIPKPIKKDLFAR
ncbi:MAG TPA: hypothetical protein VNM69_22510 [Bacillus sp. (in: firmicutes)]|uniref:hypothetical protein n=1 Tax=Bacillus litorisediminis TaxID=2922713 RepID=UPI001FAF4510|nr:hypothetical protein [Bacillus litorisediminis]HWO78644.1 hypothetical protein [Bacillus sp. (in: firmicutes)]